MIYQKRFTSHLLGVSTYTSMATRSHLPRRHCVLHVRPMVIMNIISLSAVNLIEIQCIFQALQRLGSPNDRVNDMVFPRGHWTLGMDVPRLLLKLKLYWPSRASFAVCRRLTLKQYHVTCPRRRCLSSRVHVTNHVTHRSLCHAGSVPVQPLCHGRAMEGGSEDAGPSVPKLSALSQR